MVSIWPQINPSSSADKILKQWEELGLTQFIYDMYEIYHIERLQNAFEDIDKFIEEKTTAF